MRLETPVVELENLKVRLGRREILRGITCRLKAPLRRPVLASARSDTLLLGPNDEHVA
jgi:hypothetical protein